MVSDATTMKLTAVPCEVALRSSMPITTVATHTTIPVGANAVGRRQPRASSAAVTRGRSR